MVSAEVNRAIQLWEETQQLLVIGLDVPLATCLDSVNQRRWARNPDRPPVNPKNTTSKHRGVQSAMRRFNDAGVPCAWYDRVGALDRVCRELWL